MPVNTFQITWSPKYLTGFPVVAPGTVRGSAMAGTVVTAGM